jgi:hypothetical protein
MLTDNKREKMINEILAYSGEYRAANLKNITGREGYGFEFVLLRGDKVLGTVHDWGDGGPVDAMSVNRDEMQVLNVYAKQKHPDFEFENDGIFLANLYGYWDAIKSLKSKCKKKILVMDEATSKKDDNGVPLSYSIYSAEPTAENIAKIKKSNPDAIILNEVLATVEIPKVKLARPKLKV